MTTQSLQKMDDRLKQMIDKAYLVAAVTHVVRAYKMDDHKLTVVTDKKWFTVDVQHAHKLLDSFLETENEPALPAVLTATTIQSVPALKEIVMDNIRRVQASRDYIPQAAEINSQIKSMIELAKTEIEYLKLLK